MSSPDDKIDVSSASFYALHVALQTLKERCQNLQQRLTNVEDENEVLRKTSGSHAQLVPGDVNTEDKLRVLVGDLVRQKTQLTEHIAMVTKENRQLWSRLSKLTKENSSLGTSITKIRETLNSPANSGDGSVARNNNLIRSKTFTRPTPKLRDRQQVPVDIISPPNTDKSEDVDEEEENMSLEEISLQIINKLVEGKENFEQKCGEILETTTTDNLCFGFNGSKAVDACEVAETIEKCTNEATATKAALLAQQEQLRKLIQSLGENKSKCLSCYYDYLSNQFIIFFILEPICNECVKRQTEVTSNGGGEAAGVTAHAERNKEVEVDLGRKSPARTQLPLETGVAAMERTCPMCGKCYNKSQDFEIFQRHVEWHFIDDNELEMSLDKNYDMISHTAAHF